MITVHSTVHYHDDYCTVHYHDDYCTVHYHDDYCTQYSALPWWLLYRTVYYCWSREEWNDGHHSCDQIIMFETNTNLTPVVVIPWIKYAGFLEPPLLVFKQHQEGIFGSKLRKQVKFETQFNKMFKMVCEWLGIPRPWRPRLHPSISFTMAMRLASFVSNSK
jgi:hypothetical protein